MKNGVKTGKESEKKAEVNKVQSKDPYDFPSVNETVARFLTKDLYPKQADEGDPLNRPGRQFDFTERDIIETYFGKDLARVRHLEYGKDNSLTFNESLKKKYPLESYLEMPKLEAMRERINERSGLNRADPELMDFEY